MLHDRLKVIWLACLRGSALTNVDDRHRRVSARVGYIERKIGNLPLASVVLKTCCYRERTYRWQSAANKKWTVDRNIRCHASGGTTCTIGSSQRRPMIRLASKIVSMGRACAISFAAWQDQRCANHESEIRT